MSRQRGQRVLARLFQNWVQQILRPVFITVLTTCILVVGSLVFKPIRSFLFPPEAIPDYPLYCTAEAYVRAGQSPRTLGVDFFVINRTGESYRREDLQAFLRAHRPDEPTVSPVIHLRYSRAIGKVDSFVFDREFNADKGEVQIVAEGTGLQIVVDYIEPRAVLKISIEIAGLPSLGSVTRATRGAVPFDDLETYERGCYSR